MNTDHTPRRWTDRIRDRRENRESNIPWWVNDKLRLAEFCHGNDIPFPETIATWRHPGEVDLSVAPRSFVLKPSVMFSMWGVMVLERIADDLYFDSMSDRALTSQQIAAEQTLVYDRCKYKSSYRIFIEERVVDEEGGYAVPRDFKLLCFYDQVKLVWLIDRNGSKPAYGWYDQNFSLLPRTAVVHEEDKLEYAVADVPSSALDMVDIAARLTTLLRTPFMRVDMYATTRGAVVGELTPSPGIIGYGTPARLSDELDLALGEEWTKALSRIPTG